MRFTFYLLTVLTFCFSITAIHTQAQEKKDLIDQAEVDFALYRYSDARDKYLAVYERSQNSAVLSPLSECYIKLNDYDNASKYLSLLVETGNASDADKYALANVQMTLGYYDSAHLLYEELSRRYPDNALYEIKAESCDSAVYWKEADRDRIYNMRNINSEYSDIGPSFYDSHSMIFSSEKMDYATVDMDAYTDKKNKFDWTNGDFYKLYQVDNIGQGNEVLRGFSKTFNDVAYHVGPICFNANYDIAYVTYTNFGSPSSYNVRLKIGDEEEDAKIKDRKLMIYQSKRINGFWADPVPLAIDMGGAYNVCHPSLDPDGNTLYFASDMPGGFGKFDIWYIKKDSRGQWSKPVNCGKQINTSEDELFPFIHSTGNLYFSSRGLHGLGGMDIYVARGYSNFWDSPQNLKAPINSSYDDFSISFSPYAYQVGLYSSNRPDGKGSDDIYGFILDYKNQKQKEVEFYVYDDDTHKAITGAEINIKSEGIDYYDLRTDNAGLAQAQIESGVNYQIKVNKQYYRDLSMPLTLMPISDDKIRIELPLIKSLQYREYEEGQTVKLKNLYYDFDKATIRPDAAKILDELVILMRDKYPTMRILLSSHTDSRGTKEYNLDLSRRRAEAAWQYLTAHGISGNRIERQGMGESQPVNGCVDAVPCTEEQYQENRRTEIKVLSL